MGGVTEPHNCVGSEGAASPLNPTQQPDITFVITPILYIQPKVWPKSLSLKPIDEHLKCFAMLGMYSQGHKGQMSQICDISPLRVKSICFK